MNLWLWLGVSWLAAAAMMFGVWLIGRWTKDAGYVDVAWGLGTAAIGSALALGSDGLWERRVLGSALITLWAVRLSGYILVRLLTAPAEDGRYVEFKRQFGAQAQWRLFRFYQAQALGCVGFALPLLFVGRNTAPLGWIDAAAVVVWIVAIGGESLADWQLSRFRKEPANRGQVCDRGLWRYSRHPNYFFEWLHWWTYVLLAVFAPWGWLTLLGPAAMYYFIVHVTGIPPAEAQSLANRGEAYRRYQRRTSAFWPWPPRDE